MDDIGRDEKCRVIAEWLGMIHPHTVSHDEQQAGQSDLCNLCGVPRHSHDNGIPDFYFSESASALILEKLPLPHVWKDKVDKLWYCDPTFANDDLITSHTERQTAIAEAGYQVAMAEKENQ